MEIMYVLDLIIWGQEITSQAKVQATEFQQCFNSTKLLTNKMNDGERSIDLHLPNVESNGKVCNKYKVQSNGILNWKLQMPLI